MTTGVILVGTNTGNVVAMCIQVKLATKEYLRTIELCPNGNVVVCLCVCVCVCMCMFRNVIFKLAVVY